MIETFLGTEHITYFSQSEKPLVMPWSWTVLFHYASSAPLHLLFNVTTQYVGGRAVFCVQTILTYVFAAVVHTEAPFVDIELMEISTFHLTEACISIQNKQFILRNMATRVLLRECVCLLFLFFRPFVHSTFTHVPQRLFAMWMCWTFMSVPPSLFWLIPHSFFP